MTWGWFISGFTTLVVLLESSLTSYCFTWSLTGRIFLQWAAYNCTNSACGGSVKMRNRYAECNGSSCLKRSFKVPMRVHPLRGNDTTFYDVWFPKTCVLFFLVFIGNYCLSHSFRTAPDLVGWSKRCSNSKPWPLGDTYTTASTSPPTSPGWGRYIDCEATSLCMCKAIGSCAPGHARYGVHSGARSNLFGWSLVACSFVSPGSFPLTFWKCLEGL
jgi:hypothetical protein